MSSQLEEQLAAQQQEKPIVIVSEAKDIETMLTKGENLDTIEGIPSVFKRVKVDITIFILLAAIVAFCSITKYIDPTHGLIILAAILVKWNIIPKTTNTCMVTIHNGQRTINYLIKSPLLLKNQEITSRSIHQMISSGLNRKLTLRYTDDRVDIRSHRTNNFDKLVTYCKTHLADKEKKED